MQRDGDGFGSRVRVELGLVLLLVLCSAVLPSAHSATQYFYDNLGRLTNVINSDGSVIEYRYDANGNVTVINRISSQTLSITQFAPTSAHVGSAVTVYGAGFNSDPAQNSVTIGGAAAAVSSATSNSLLITVPSSAVTGPIAVTVAGVTVTSAQNFIVLRPAITSFSPTVANAGAAITLLGANLNRVPGGTAITVGSTSINVISLTNSQAVFAAPTSSGYIVVDTPYGQATSSTPLTIVPAAITPANVVALAELGSAGSPQTISVNQQNKYGLFKFEATQGEFLSLQFSSLTTVPNGSAISYQVYSPAGTSILSGAVSRSSPSIHLPEAAATGTYIVAMTSSTATFQASASLEVNAAVTADGASLPVATTVALQTKRFTFTGTAGENLGLGISNLVNVTTWRRSRRAARATPRR